MEIAQAQRDVRETFLGGFAGQFVSSLVWGASAAACTLHSFHLGELVLLLGGVFIFPLTQLMLWGMGHAYALPRGHPMNALGIQVAFSLSLNLPLLIGIAALRPVWFYPACMIAVGAHYLPFVFSYGMWQFAVLCGIMVAGGVVIAMHPPGPVSFAAWLTAAVLLVFAFVGRHVALRSENRAERP